ncbi:cytochrome P450 [Streptomyces sp. NPDC085932]|uniref:cytochrome P450 n=1 Tax=Streptomyces sp. NPDC085932 TaxID=3365741 RepID=UPI0037D5E297
MITADPPEHTRLRQAVEYAFSTQTFDKLHRRVGRSADDLIDRFAVDGSADLLTQYARPLASSVLDELFGVPYEERDALHGWALTLTDSSAESLATSGAAFKALHAYMKQLASDKATCPGSDLVSGLALAPPHHRLDLDEQANVLALVHTAGYETMVNLVAQCLATLLSHPDQRRLYDLRPWLADAIVEETLRFDGPVFTSSWRFAREDVDIAGVRVRAGDAVICGLAAANRDPRHFPSPDRFNIAHPARWHLAFGHGVHQCFGAPLARLTAEAALDRFFRRLPDVQLAVQPDAVRYRPSATFRSPERVLVTFTPEEP